MVRLFSGGAILKLALRDERPILKAKLHQGCSMTKLKIAAMSIALLAASSAAGAAPDQIFRFKIGTLKAAALSDGSISTPNDGKTFGLGRAPEEVAAVLEAARLPSDHLDLAIQPLLVRSGTQILLFDTGAGRVEWADGGRLQASLRAAGVEPAQVTDIFISHAHLDHVGGLVTPDGTLAFPAATIRMSKPEWASMQADASLGALTRAVAPKVVAFDPGAAVLLGLVTAVAVNGHTPGHSAYEIASGADRLLYIGDSAHHSVISVQKPDWRIDYDVDAPKAEASRRALLQRVADHGLRLYAPHFPFPGLGRVKTQGEGFVWVPEYPASGLGR